jgi:L-amino acid N-acyltransferase YncA
LIRKAFSTQAKSSRLPDVELVIDQMRPADWPAIEAIYAEGIATGNATFETALPTWQEWDQRHLSVCRLAAREGGHILGWAALSRVSARPVYAGVAEVSVYVAEAVQGRGFGRALLRRLVDESERQGLWTLQASIFPENEASLRTHWACGFREVGRRERIAQLNAVWRDTVLLERRSQTAGV